MAQSEEYVKQHPLDDEDWMSGANPLPPIPNVHKSEITTTSTTPRSKLAAQLNAEAKPPYHPVPESEGGNMGQASLAKDEKLFEVCHSKIPPPMAQEIEDYGKALAASRLDHVKENVRTHSTVESSGDTATDENDNESEPPHKTMKRTQTEITDEEDSWIFRDY
jgi:hypothetical protein